ncbi:MAG TPA: hypothetical protein V6C58_18150 [Allocoleopsis sp.]
MPHFPHKSPHIKGDRPQKAIAFYFLHKVRSLIYILNLTQIVGK